MEPHMHRLAGIVVLVALASPSRLAQQGLLAQNAGVELAVARRVRAYFAAMGTGKVDVIEESLADDYLVIGGDGKMETRAERLTWLRGNAKSLAAVSPSELRVRTYGVTAVATGLVTIPQDAGAAPIEERFTQVWLQRRGTWQMVSGQITIVRK